LGRLLLLDHGLASMAVTCHAFGIQERNFKMRQRGLRFKRRHKTGRVNRMRHGSQGNT